MEDCGKYLCEHCRKPCGKQTCDDFFCKEHASDHLEDDEDEEEEDETSIEYYEKKEFATLSSNSNFQNIFVAYKKLEGEGYTFLTQLSPDDNYDDNSYGVFIFRKMKSKKQGEE